METSYQILHAGALAVNGHVRDAQVMGFLRITPVDLKELCVSVVLRTRPLVSLVRLTGCRRSRRRYPLHQPAAEADQAGQALDLKWEPALAQSLLNAF